MTDLHRQLQQQGKHHLRNRRGTVSGNVGDRYPLFPGEIKVDDVHPGGENADVAQLRQFFQQRTVHDRFVGQHQLGISCPLYYQLRRRPVIDGTGGKAFDPSPAEVTGIKSMPVQNNEFHMDLRFISLLHLFLL